MRSRRNGDFLLRFKKKSLLKPAFGLVFFTTEDIYNPFLVCFLQHLVTGMSPQTAAHLHSPPWQTPPFCSHTESIDAHANEARMTFGSTGAVAWIIHSAGSLLSSLPFAAFLSPNHVSSLCSCYRRPCRSPKRVCQPEYYYNYRVCQCIPNFMKWN